MEKKIRQVYLGSLQENYDSKYCVAILEVLEGIGTDLKYDKENKILTISASAENFVLDSFLQTLEISGEVGVSYGVDNWE